MTDSIRVRGLTKNYGRNTVLDGLDFTVQQNTICGLLGRNGAGKTTLMSILAGQELATGGTVEVLGADPFENAAVLANLSFARENQKYPEDFKPVQVLRTAPWFYPNWDDELAGRLVEDFRVPLKTPIKKLSRGQLSAVAIVVGLASRAPVTFFDEPYLGLDATARSIFYDRLLTDYLEHPRTVLMSTHLIDEAASLLEQVIVLEGGKKVLDAGVEEARQAAFTLSGPAEAVLAAAAHRVVLRTQALGGLRSVTMEGTPDDDIRGRAAGAGLEIGAVSLQELVSAYGLLAGPDAANPGPAGAYASGQRTRQADEKADKKKEAIR